MAITYSLEPTIKQDSSSARPLQMNALLPDAPLVLSNAELRQAKGQLKEGDIIFRTGNAWSTQLPAPFANNATYSHGGIITVEASRIKVVHAAIEGTGDPVVKAESLADFLQQGNTTHAAVYRLKASTPKVQQAIATAAKTYAAKDMPLNAKFGLTSNDQAYCSELIWRAYLEAGIDLSEQSLGSGLASRLESFSFPFSGRNITPDSLSASVSLRPVYQFDQVQSMQSSVP